MNRHLTILLLYVFMATSLFAQEVPAQDEDQNELNVTAERMEIFLDGVDGRVIELTDNVRFEDNTMTLTADCMKIFLVDEPTKDAHPEGEPQTADKKDNTSMAFKRIEANGNVLLRKKLDATESAAGSHAVYDTEKDLVVLSGDCIIRQQGHTMKGQEVLFDRKKQKISVKGAEVRIQLRKGQNKGIDDLLGNKKKEGKAEKKSKPEENKPAEAN